MSKRAGVRRFGVPFVAAFAMAMALVLSIGSPAYAAGCTTTPATSAALVTAVASGSPGDVICLNAGIQYSPTSALDVNRNITVETDPAQIASGGRGATINGGVMTTVSTIDPSQLDVFAIAAGKTLTVSNVTFTGTLQPSNATIFAAPAPAGGGSGGTLLLDHSTISSNQSAGVDAEAGAVATITNSTITQANSADGIVDNGTVNLNEDTIADNGLNGINNHGGGSANVFNTILTGNPSGNCFFPITVANGSGSNSDDSATTCGTLITTGGAQSTGTGVITGTSPINNGGPTNTFALPSGSVAINHGTGTGAAATDQRGYLRDATPDVGAYEFGATAPATLFVIKHVVGPGSASAFTMTVTGASASPGSFPGAEAPGTAVTVASGQTYTVGETGPTANYTSAQSGNCTGPIASGATGTCTVTNTAKPTQLTVIKHVDNTGGGTATASQFTMTVTDTSTSTVLGSFPGAEAPGSPAVSVPAGDNYTVTESGALTSSYTQSNSAGCSGTATANGAVTCTVTNSFLSCPQPPNSGPQPGPGAPGSSANTCVTANIATTILVTAPSTVSFPPIGATATSSPVAVPVNVKSNDPAGYQLSVIRTPFTGGDIPLSISGAAVAAPQAYDAPLPALTPIPTVTPNLNIGETTGAITPAAGDNWPLSFVLGPVPFGIPAGAHQSVVTFTAIAK
jgi:hypothetical protein